MRRRVARAAVMCADTMCFFAVPETGANARAAYPLALASMPCFALERCALRWLLIKGIVSFASLPRSLVQLLRFLRGREEAFEILRCSLVRLVNVQREHS